MRILVAAAIALLGLGVRAECTSALELDGMLTIETCEPGTKKCRLASEVVVEYMSRFKDSNAVFTIALPASPWHLYDGSMRLLTIEEMAERIRPALTSRIERIELIGSWTGVAPEEGGKSLAQKLSEALDGFPVTGMDGFLWVSKRGKLRTTRQAFTTTKGMGPYGVRAGDDVMVSYVAGWASALEQHFFDEGLGSGVARAGAGWDIFHLCPERALAAYEAAAKLDDPIGAYNAAMMRLERAGEGDRDVAVILLSKALALGDEKAQARLDELNRNTQE